MSEYEEQKRIVWIDVARGIGILLVIIGHIGPAIVSGWIYSFHMPLFFFLSGICFNPRKSYKEFLVRKLKSIVIPYFFLGVVAILFEFFFYKYDVNWITDAFLNLVVQKKFMTIWFLACLFITENLFFFLYKTKNKAFIITMSIVSFVAGAIYYRLGGIDLPWCIDSAFMALPFFCSGFYGKDIVASLTVKEKGRKEVLKIMIFFLLGAVQILLWYINRKYFGYQFAMYNNNYLLEFLTVPAAFIGIYCVIVVSQRCQLKILRYIGKNSLIYFAWHQVIMFPIADIIVYEWIAQLVNNKAFLYVLYIVAIVILCTLANVLVMKSPLKVLVGKWKKVEAVSHV